MAVPQSDPVVRGRGPLVARYLLALMWFWLALTSFTGVGQTILSRHLGGHRFLGSLAGHVPEGVLGGVVGALQLAVALLLVTPAAMSLGRRVGARLSAGLAVVPLTLLFTNPVWMESLGGFPAIGSGQGLLKYAAVLGLSVYVLGIEARDEVLERRGLTLTVVGLILPLLWIGGMKFTGPEARGIEGLLSSSPFFSWMYEVFSVQGASNVIGLTELVTVGLLASFRVRPALGAIGGALGVGTFLATLSFLVTAPGWSAAGFPFLGGSGVFLVKDLALLAASAVVVLHGWGGSTARGRLVARA